MKRGVHFRDVKTDTKFFYSTLWPNVVQVLHIRKFCESRELYSRFKDRGFGFLKLTYREQELQDDSAHFFATFRYRELHENSPAISDSDYVLIEVREAKRYELSCESITHSIQCHSETTVRQLRQTLALVFGVVLDSLTVFLDGAALNNSTRLFSLPSDKLTFTARGYIIIPTTVGPTLFPESGTAVDFVSVAQNMSLARSDSKVVQSMQLLIGGFRPNPRDVVSNILNRGHKIEWKHGRPIEGQTVDFQFSFHFDSGPVRSIQICSGCSLSFARHEIAKVVSVPFEQVELFWNSKCTWPVELWRPIDWYLAMGRPSLYVEVPSITIRFKVTKKMEFEHRVPLSDRVFDVKRRISKILNESFHKIQLFLGLRYADDEFPIARLGLTNTSTIRVNILQDGIFRHYFRDLEGKTNGWSFPAKPDANIGQMAAHFLSDNPIEVGYTWEGHPLKRSTLLSDIVCDPLVPICVFRRQLILDVRFRRYPQWNTQLPVTADTRVGEVTRTIKELHSSVKSLTVRMAGHDASRQNVRLTELDPDLEEPIIVRRVRFDSNSVRLNFTIEGERFSVLVQQGGRTCGEMKQDLGRVMNIPAGCLSILFGAAPLSDTEHLLKLKSKYIVKVSNFKRRFGVELVI
jgi:hypothetical protein